MRSVVLFLWMALLFGGCETGTKYEKNATSTATPTPQIEEEEIIDNLIGEEEDGDEEKNDYEEVEEASDSTFREEGYFDEPVHFEGGVMSEGLNIKNIRKGRHHDYLRLVFDVSKVLAYTDSMEEGDVDEVGYYNATYHPEERLLTVVINGYKSFTAPFPTFSKSEIVKKIYLVEYPHDRGYKFNIELREGAEVKVFDLKKPARMVFDIKAI